MQQGMQQGTQNALLLMLGKKFGPVPNDVKVIIEQADEEQLLPWLEQTLLEKLHPSVYERVERFYFDFFFFRNYSAHCIAP